MLRIRELRRAKDMTQSEVARQLGVSQASVSDWESGRKSPSLETFIRVGKVFGCSLDYLAGLSDTNIVANAG